MTISVFKDFINDAIIPLIEKNYKNFDGDIIDLEDQLKDDICYNFLINFPSWWDDVLPPATACRFGFLDELYNRSLGQNLSEIIRNDIYEYLESTLAEILAEEWAEHTGEYAEPFQGYGRGE